MINCLKYISWGPHSDAEDSVAEGSNLATGFVCVECLPQSKDMDF